MAVTADPAVGLHGTGHSRGAFAALHSWHLAVSALLVGGTGAWLYRYSGKRTGSAGAAEVAVAARSKE